jgi:hypothetical protein
VGTLSLMTQIFAREFSQTIIHKAFKSSRNSNDLGLLHLETNVNQNLQNV